MLFLFIKSVILGISIAAPIGPISTLAIKNCITRGFKIGFATSFGASITEGFYGFVATGGLAFISRFLTSHIDEVKLISGTALVMLAIYEVKTAKDFKFEEIKMKSVGFFKTMFMTTFLTLGSPMTIVLFVGVFATMTGKVMTPDEMAITVLGIFTGSVIWAFILCGTVSKLHHKLSKKMMARVKIAAATVIGSFGIYGISSVLF
jgi:threonine/homoserine/homoserine lactone efflux protein